MWLTVLSTHRMGIEGDQLHGFHCSDPRSCDGVNSPDMFEFMHGLLVIGDGTSVLMGHVCCQLNLYILPLLSI